MDGKGRKQADGTGYSCRREGSMSQGKTEGLVGREMGEGRGHRKEGALGTSTLRRCFQSFAVRLTHCVERFSLAPISHLPLMAAVPPHWDGAPSKGRMRPLLLDCVSLRI